MQVVFFITGITYLVLAHSMTQIEDDPLAHHCILICRVVVKTVVGLAPVLKLAKGSNKI